MRKLLLRALTLVPIAAISFAAQSALAVDYFDAAKTSRVSFEGETYLVNLSEHNYRDISELKRKMSKDQIKEFLINNERIGSGNGPSPD